MPDRDDLDRAACEALRKAGDVAGVLRRVQHFAVFPKREQADGFRDRIEYAGYNVTATDEKTAGGRKGWVVDFQTTMAVDLDSVRRHTRALEREVAAWHGEYLGWQTERVRPLEVAGNVRAYEPRRR